jgi:hypothetical protein
MKLEEIKNKTKEATDYLVQSLEAGHSEVLTQYLGAMAKFHTYSFGNIMLIARQKPSATNVAGVRTWNSLGRSSGVARRAFSFSLPWSAGRAKPHLPLLWLRSERSRFYHSGGAAKRCHNYYERRQKAISESCFCAEKK